MDLSNRTSQQQNGRDLLLKKLRQEQEQYGEGSCHWTLLEERINQLIAQNYLEYVNR